MHFFSFRIFCLLATLALFSGLSLARAKSSAAVCLASNTPGTYGYSYNLVYCENQRAFGASNVDESSLLESTNQAQGAEGYEIAGNFFGGNLKVLSNDRIFQCVVVVGKSARFIWQKWSSESHYLVDCGSGTFQLFDPDGESGNVLESALMELNQLLSIDGKNPLVIKRAGQSDDLQSLKRGYAFAPYRWVPQEIRLYSRIPTLE